jgi:hypothetical protein
MKNAAVGQVQAIQLRSKSVATYTLPSAKPRAM